jgi:hypothetical protein
MFLLMELYLSKVHLTCTAVMMQCICFKNIMNRSSAFPLTSMHLIRYDRIVNRLWHSTDLDRYYQTVD